MNRPSVTIITDGSGTANIPNGGWAAIIHYQHSGRVIEKIITGHIPGKVSNIICEMSAVVGGLSALKQSCDVTLITDLKMIQGGIHTWLGNWVKRGWRKSDGKPPENVELWKQIHLLTKMHRVKVEWVKGHNHHPLNERADKYAGMARLGQLTNEVNYL